MATFNCAGTVEEALESIYCQSYQDWELVICDDASTDGTYEILQRFASQAGSRIVLLRNERNSKLSYSLNRCLEAASGELIARMDADDVSHPDRFERQVGFLESMPEVDLVGTAMRRFDSAGPADVVQVAAAPDRYTLRQGVPFCHATILTYRRVYDAVGGYTVSRRTERGQDYDLWFRFFHAGFVGRNLTEPLYFVREDLNAVRRRTLGVRFQSFRTSMIGYRLLGYPIHWYALPLLRLGKGLVPSRAVLLYRRVQQRSVRRQRPH